MILKKTVLCCRRRKNLRAMLAMSVCFAANIGGTGTTIGTGPNLVLLGNLDEKFKGHPLSFGTWMAFAIPIEIVCLLLLWLWLQFYYLPWPFSRNAQAGQAVQNKGQEANGPGNEGSEGQDAQEEPLSSKIARLIKAKCIELGPLTFKEGVVLAHFLVLVILWFVRSPGFFKSYGDIEDRPEIGVFHLNLF